ncbi:hypothetical protein QYM36_010980, partial [Artemia franciscana]
MRFMQVANLNYYREFFKNNLPRLASRKGCETTEDVLAKPPSYKCARLESIS